MWDFDRKGRLLYVENIHSVNFKTQKIPWTKMKPTNPIPQILEPYKYTEGIN